MKTGEGWKISLRQVSDLFWCSALNCQKKARQLFELGILTGISDGVTFPGGIIYKGFVGTIVLFHVLCSNEFAPYMSLN